MSSQVIIRYDRQGGTPPSDDEKLTIDDDGSFSMWRTIARAAQPASAVGSFAGAVPADAMDRIRDLAPACAEAGPVSLDVPRGASSEIITVGDSRSSCGEYGPLPGPWGALADLLRTLLGSLTASPRAAVHLTGGEGGPTLRHLGHEPLQLDFSRAEIRLVRWQDGGAAENRFEPVTGLATVTAAPGWEWPVPAANPWPDARTTVHIDNLLLSDGTSWHTAALDPDE